MTNKPTAYVTSQSSHTTTVDRKRENQNYIFLFLYGLYTISNKIHFCRFQTELVKLHEGNLVLAINIKCECVGYIFLHTEKNIYYTALG